MKKAQTQFLSEKLFRLKKDPTALFCLTVLLIFFSASFLLPLFLPHSPHQVYGEFLNLPPFWMEGSHSNFLLGTDDLGRDFLSRLLNGGRISFLAGGAVMFFSLLLGLLFGSLAGLFKKLDLWISGAVDILMSFPGLLLAIAMAAVLGPGLFNACFSAIVIGLPSMIRLTRSLVLREKEKNYCIAARCLGARWPRLLYYHILPNIKGELLAQNLLLFCEGILTVAALSFLGLGVEAPIAEWGLMIADGRAYLETSWWLTAFPGFCLLIMIFCVNILGEKLKE